MIKDLYRWLKNQPADAVAGRAGISDSCVLATYYKDTEEGLDTISVGMLGITRFFNLVTMAFPGVSRSGPTDAEMAVMAAFDIQGLRGEEISAEQFLGSPIFNEVKLHELLDNTVLGMVIQEPANELCEANC